MSDPEKPKAEGSPESPTTAKALDFDDEQVDTPLSPSKPAIGTSPMPPNGSGENITPPKPPRPLAPEQQTENILKEAFPAIEVAVVKAVLRASGGRVEPAFNALLGMSDPDAAEPVPPPKPPRPVAQPTSTGDSQLAADERYARQLAEHYNRPSVGGYTPRDSHGPRQGQPRGPARQSSQPRPNLYDGEERERSFIDDDLPVIRDNIRKGFLETQSTVNKWVTNLKKKIDGEDDDEFQNRRAAPAQGSASQQQHGGRRSSEYGRWSTDRDRYDADPQVLGDDFAGLKMQDNEGQRRSTRPLANPDLFKPTPPRPQSVQSASGRRVSFQDGPPEEIDIHYPNSPSPQPPGGSAKSSKWQPLAAVDPSPVTDHDPFSLGDSDEEEGKKKHAKPNDTETLHKAAAEAISEHIGGEAAAKELESKPAETIGKP